MLPRATVTLHFIHIRKTGGTAIKTALADSGAGYWQDRNARRAAPTRYGPIKLHRHDFHLRDVPWGDHAFFCVRDPIARFVSRFHSRLNEGRPAHFWEWNEAEKVIFERYRTPQALASELGSDDPAVRDRATWAMIHMRHQTHMQRWLGPPGHVRVHLRKIAYIARQETLSTDWEQLKELLGLPGELELPSDDRAHRSALPAPVEFDAAGERALREWYDVDYRLLDYCDRLRAWRGWGAPPPPSGVRRLSHDAARLRSVGAIRPTAWSTRAQLGRLRARLTHR